MTRVIVCLSHDEQTRGVGLDNFPHITLITMAPAAAKSLNRLPREAIVDLALQWLRADQYCTPYLLSNRTGLELDDEDYLHTPAQDVESLRKFYRTLKRDQTQSTKRDIIDRIVDGDWRRGLSLHQHAMIDLAHLEHNDTALRWSALQLVPLELEKEKVNSCEESGPANKRRRLNNEGSKPQYPQISPAAFLSALKTEISPLVKAHYHLHRLPPPNNLSLIRLHIDTTSTFSQRRSKVPRRAKVATDSARIMYIALPDSCPYVYVSLSGATARDLTGTQGKASAKVDMAAMKKLVLEAIPKALSRPQERWALANSKLTVRSLRSLAALRGNQKPGSGGGAYCSFSANVEPADTSPVDVESHHGRENNPRLRAVEQRFGTMAEESHAPLDRVHVIINDVFGGSDKVSGDDLNTSPASVGLTFAGTDVFRGLKKLAEMDAQHMSLENMPAWMTGESAKSTIIG